MNLELVGRGVEIKKVLKQNPNSPLPEGIIATDLIQRRDLASIYIGRVPLLRIKNKYDSGLEPRYMILLWNEK